MRFLDKKLKSERSDFSVPRSVQNAIPVKTIYEDGIFYLDKNKVISELNDSIEDIQETINIIKDN